MNIHRIALYAAMMVGVAATAVAQYGLYGSPDVMDPPQAAAPAEYGPAAGYQAPTANYPQAAYPQSSYPTSGYPQPTYAPQYRYPAQAPAAVAYQPYQSGSQYRYPSPAPSYGGNYQTAYARPQLYAGGGPQPMPAPPAPPQPGEYVPPPSALPAPMDAPAPQGCGMMEQVMADQGGCGPYRSALGRFEQAADCGGCGDGCGYCCPWYGSVSALFLSRSYGKSLWTSYQEDNPKEQGGNTQIPMEWKWGGEIRFGRRFCSGCVPYALEATYWTTEAMTGYRRTAYTDDVVNTCLNVDFITFFGLPASTWFNGAAYQTLVRRDEFQDIELNLIREQLAWCYDSPWDIGWSVGVRYFRFRESLTYDSVMPNHAPGDIYDAYLRDDVTNSLIGAQFGFDAAYNLCNSFRVFITPKVGIYNNNIDHTFYAMIGNGITPGLSTPYGVFYPISGSRNVLSFLTQIDVGLDWQLSRNWSARLGYRALIATGIATAEDQFPQMICDVPALQRPEAPSYLILHGAFFGLTYNF